MRSNRIYLLGLAGLCSVALGCDDATPGEIAAAGQRLQSHTSQQNIGQVQVFSSVDFGPEDAFQPVIDIAVVNLGKQPVVLLETPEISALISYYKSGQADTDRAPPGRWRPTGHSGGRAWYCHPSMINRISGSSKLGPSECATYHWSSPRLIYSGRTPNVMRVSVSVLWQDATGTRRRTESHFYCAPPLDRSRIPPGLPLAPES